MAAVPVRVHEGAAGPDDVVVHHDNGNVGLGKCVEVLLHPGGIAVGETAEAFRVGPCGQEQHVPTEKVDEPRDEGDVSPGHVHTGGPGEAVAPVVVFEAKNEAAAATLAEGLHGVEGEDILGVFENGLADRSEVGSPRGIGGVAHVGVVATEVFFGDENVPDEIQARTKAWRALYLTSSGLWSETSTPVTA